MDFSTVWNYVGIGNQLLATIVLWTSTAYLISRRKPHWMCSVPAAFLSFVCVSYFLMAPYKAGGLHLNPVAGYVAGTVIAVGLLLLSVYKSRK
jgi:carbon starvation protein CstA